MNSRREIFRKALLVLGVALIAVFCNITLRMRAETTRPLHSPVEDMLAELAAQDSFSIVQIGAYIGNTENDPLYPFLVKHLGSDNTAAQDRKAKVVLIEPIREYFEQLVDNYRNVAHVDFEQVAISETAGMMEMYRLDADPVAHGFPAWLDQLSSLKKERMEELWDSHEKCEAAQKFYLEHRVVEQVQCVTLHDLLDKHQIQHLDLLQIDAEGYDYEILKTVDFDRFKPEYINYERVLLHENEAACRQMMINHGYDLVDWDQDTLCILKDQKAIR